MGNYTNYTSSVEAEPAIQELISRNSYFAGTQSSSEAFLDAQQPKILIDAELPRLLIFALMDVAQLLLGFS